MTTQERDEALGRYVRLKRENERESQRLRDLTEQANQDAALLGEPRVPLLVAEARPLKRGEILARLMHEVKCRHRVASESIVDFTPSAAGWLVWLSRESTPRVVDMRPDERDALWAAWNDATQ